MSFFEHQAQAKRHTLWLLLAFTAALALTVFVLNVGFYLLLSIASPLQGAWYWHEASPWVAGFVLMMVGSGSAFTAWQLRSGGLAMAQLLKARALTLTLDDRAERLLRHVTDEMAIAAGLPVPALYVLENESGINAFVAGSTPNNAALFVTSGLLASLDRPALQAVVAHEFSHILNGDMRLNIRLLALLDGLFWLSRTGRVLMDAASSGHSFGRRQSTFPPVFVLGLLIFAVGSVGLFCGRLIKASISRQREFLADASSVQFTRFPDGLADALMTIAEHHDAGYLRQSYADTVSHMAIAPAMLLSRWLQTHPSLDERLKRLGPEVLARVKQRRRERRENPPLQAIGLQEQELPMVDYVAPAAATTMPNAAFVETEQTVAQMMAQAGWMSAESLQAASDLMTHLPTVLTEALESPVGVQAMAMALLSVAVGYQDRDASYAALCPALAHQSYPELLCMTELVAARALLLPVAEQQALWRGVLDVLGRAPAKTRLGDALLLLLRKRLKARRPVLKRRSLAEAALASGSMVALLLEIDGMPLDARSARYQRLMRTVFDRIPPWETVSRLSWSALSRLLDDISGLNPRDKQQVLELAVTAALVDGRIHEEEYALLHVAAALLDCPMPVLPL